MKMKKLSCLFSKFFLAHSVPNSRRIKIFGKILRILAEEPLLLIWSRSPSENARIEEGDVCRAQRFFSKFTSSQGKNFEVILWQTAAVNRSEKLYAQYQFLVKYESLCPVFESFVYNIYRSTDASVYSIPSQKKLNFDYSYYILELYNKLVNKFQNSICVVNSLEAGTKD